MNANNRYGKPVVVNYTRRFVTEIQALASKARNGAYGAYLSGQCLYGKGIMNNGSHAIDLVRLMLGDISGWKSLSAIVDHDPQDPSINAALSLKKGGVFTMSCVDQRHFGIFEIDMLFAKGRIRLIDSGRTLEEYEVIENPVWHGYKSLRSLGARDTSLTKAMLMAVENIYGIIHGTEKPQCTLEDAYTAQLICSGIKESLSEPN
jgi:predicted dehydrogenase